MEPPLSTKRVAKRSSNACVRCRRQKIRCSGLQPCDGCSKRKLSCVFDDRDNKVLVTQGHLSDLHAKIAELERSTVAHDDTISARLGSPSVHGDRGSHNTASQQQRQQQQQQHQHQSSPITDHRYGQGDQGFPPMRTTPPPSSSSKDSRHQVQIQEPRDTRQRNSRSDSRPIQQISPLQRDQEGAPSIQPPDVLPVQRASPPSAAQSEPDAAELTNPLATSPSTYMRNAYGRTFHLGTSSIWSFAGRILQLTHLHLYKAPLPSSVILFDGSAYDLRWDGMRAKGALDESPVIPSHDYVIFLINAVKFHGGQMFHLFDEDTFKENLDCFYGSPIEERVNGTSLWYIHFLLILALGKAFIRSRAINNEAPGASYFVKAMQILPDTTALCRDPVASTEILCCIALYLQSVDHRNSAHVFIGQAMRVALGYGMHTAMPVEELGEPYVQRCRKAWWTTYILDSQMTSLMGLPPSIRDADIHCELPSFSGSTQKATALAIHIRLSCIITEINNTIYGADGRFNKRFLISTKNALESAASLADELRQAMPLKLDEPGAGVQRLSASLHLLCHQCIVLATRPVVFCCLRMKYDNNPSLRTVTASRKIQKLLHVCAESCHQIISILENLQVQGILETFMTFDLDSLFVAAIVLLIKPIVDPILCGNQMDWVRRAFALLDDMIAGGNLIAAFRKSQAEKLSGMLLEISHIDQMATAAAKDAGAGAELAPDGASLRPRRHRSRATDASVAEEVVGTAGLFQAGQQHPVDGNFGSIPSLPYQQGLHHQQQHQQQHQHQQNVLFYGNLDEWTTEQIMAIAESIESEDAEWIALTMGENGMPY